MPDMENDDVTLFYVY